MTTKFALELFDWIAPYNGSESGIGLVAINQIASETVELISKHQIVVKDEQQLVNTVLAYCNMWSKTSSDPFTDAQKQAFVKMIDQLIQVEQN